MSSVNNWKTRAYINIKLDDIKSQLDSNTTGYYAASLVHRQYTPAMPRNTGQYEKEIDYSVPWQYTHKADHSIFAYNINMNFRTTKNPYAMAHYIDGFASVAKPKIEKNFANYTRRNIVKG